MSSNKGAGPFWDQTRGKIRKIFLSWTIGWNALIFGIEHPWGKEIQVCSNEVPRVTNGHARRGHSFYPRSFNFYILIYRELLKKYSSQQMLDQIGQKLAWSIPRVRKFKFIHIQSLGLKWLRPKGTNFIKVYIAKTFKDIFLMNHWPKCIYISHWASLGTEDSSFVK